MAQLSFTDLMSSNNNSDKNRIGFFSLKDDGNEALVRIMHDDVESLMNEAFSLHTIDLNGKTRKINCVKEAYDTTDACPLCAANMPLQNRVFVRLIEYTKDERGNIIATPKIWERPAKSCISELSGYINEYGPLSKCMFKIRRHGAAGSKETSYQFLPLMATNYPEDKFPAGDMFGDYKVLGSFVLNKTADDINTYLSTGNFPMNNATTGAEVPSGTPYSNSQAGVPFDDPVDDFMPQQQRPVPGVNPGVAKPTRFY